MVYPMTSHTDLLAPFVYDCLVIVMDRLVSADSITARVTSSVLFHLLLEFAGILLLRSLAEMSEFPCIWIISPDHFDPFFIDGIVPSELSWVRSRRISLI